MKKTGELLKQARESKNLTIQEVAMATKINHRVLKAIEEGDTANLPAKTFLRGFVISYATLLKLDTEMIIQLMAEELQLPPKKNPVIEKPIEVASSANKVSIKTAVPSDIKAEVSISRQPEKTVPLQRKSNEAAKALAVGILIVGLLSLIFLSSKIVEKYTKEAEIDKSQETLAKSPIMLPPTEPDLNLTPEAPTSDATTANAVTSAVIDAQSNSSKSPSPTPTVAQAVVAVPTPTPTLPAPTPSPISKVSPTPSPQTATATNNKNIELIIEAKADIEVSYSTKNGANGNFKLSKDQIHTFKSKNGINISLSTGGAANIILNGKDLGTPGEKNKPLNLIY